MTDENPLAQAMQMKKQDLKPDDAQRILEFILAHFDLVSKDEEKSSDIVTTQESHTP